MVLILDGNSEIVAHVRIDFLFDLIKAFVYIQSNLKKIPKKGLYSLTCGATYSDIPSNIISMIRTQ